MDFSSTDKIIKQMMVSGRIHHSYEWEIAAKQLFLLDESSLLELFKIPSNDHPFGWEGENLGPTRLRGMKNGIIAIITVVCRYAIQFGVDVNYSYCLSDYYINQAELTQTEQELFDLLKTIILHYHHLVALSQKKQYSKPIASAMRYIKQHIYEPIKVKDIAEYVGLNCHYFSSLFKKETGTTPHKFIQEQKLFEAKQLLQNKDTSVTTVAEALGFSDTAHFSKCFKHAYGILPSEYAKLDVAVLGLPQSTLSR